MLSTDSCVTSANILNTENSALLCESQSVEDSAIQQQIQPAALSAKHRRACLKKERRKRKRQALAKVQSHTGDQPESEQEPDGDKEDEELRERLHQEWLEREHIAQEEFRLKKEKEEAARKRKEDEEKRIREEWEERQKTEREAQEQKWQQKRDRETKERVKGLWISSSLEENETVQKLLDQVETQLENGGTWKNPDAPVDFGTEKDKANCPFFLKTGSCRFGDRCSRKHAHPLVSSTLMVRSMFVTYAMEQSRRDDYDTDAGLEYSEEELQQQFLDFYEDVLTEFKNAGKVIQFKVSCNFEPHLRGNVYIQYETEDQCKEAFRMFNGRWYAGRQLQCEFCPVSKWKTAICGLFDRQKCPKGKHCNFLHVFRNPNNEFWEADRDMHLSPDRGGGFTGRRRMTSQRGYSPEQSSYRRSERRSRSREKYGHGRRRSRSRERRSRSRERRSRSRSRESRRYQRSQRRGRGSWNGRGRSRSRERRRSRSRGREMDRHSGDHLKNSQTRSSRKSESELPEEETKNGSDKRKRRKSKSKSPHNGDANTTSHHHKRSKKSKRKKKSKKKQKRRRNKSSSSSSSSGSGRESEEEEEEEEESVKDEDKQNTLKPAEKSEITDPITLIPDDTETQEQPDVSHLSADTVSECDTAALLNKCT